MLKHIQILDDAYVDIWFKIALTKSECKIKITANMFHVLFANIYMDKAFGIKLTIRFFF